MTFLPIAARRRIRRVAGLAVASACVCCTPSFATPWIPSQDSEIVETLPAVAGWSKQERRLRRELVQRPHDERAALEAARAYLGLARTQGDARYAGYALGVLQAWEPMNADTPNRILVMHATVTQFLHDFDGAEATLKMALAKEPDNAQGWLTLATILRVRGRYAESDTACRELRERQPVYATACLAENMGLRGDTAGAMAALKGLLDNPLLQNAQQASTRQWLLTTVAEVQELAGHAGAADAAYKAALDAERAGYDVIAYSDFLLDQGRAAEVPALLDAEPRSDTVLLRLVIAERRLAAQGKLPAAREAGAKADAEEMAQRFEAAALRPGATALHAREHALFALEVQNDPKHALELARLDIALQREPTDYLVMARAAVAARDDAARQELRALMRQTGFRDARVDAIL